MKYVLFSVAYVHLLSCVFAIIPTRVQHLVLLWSVLPNLFMSVALAHPAQTFFWRLAVAIKLNMHSASWLFKQVLHVFQWTGCLSSTCKLLRWNCLRLPIVLSNWISFSLTSIVCLKIFPFGNPLSIFLLFNSLLLCFSFPVGDPWSLGIIVSCTIDCMSCNENRDYGPSCVCVCMHSFVQVLFLLFCSTELLFYSPVFTPRCCVSGSFCGVVVYVLFPSITWSLPTTLTVRCCHNTF